MNKEIEKLIITSPNAFRVKFKPRVKVEIKNSVVKSPLAVFLFIKRTKFWAKEGFDEPGYKRSKRTVFNGSSGGSNERVR